MLHASRSRLGATIAGTVEGATMASGPGDGAGRSRWLGVLLLAGMMLPQMTTAMTAVALPTILADLGQGLERAGWIISAYLLPMAVLMPTWGAAGDHYGRRPVFRIGLALFGLGALMAAVSTELLMLLAGQFV